MVVSHAGNISGVRILINAYMCFFFISFFFYQTKTATSFLVAIVLDEDVICTERGVHFLDVSGFGKP